MPWKVDCDIRLDAVVATATASMTLEEVKAMTRAPNETVSELLSVSVPR